VCADAAGLEPGQVVEWIVGRAVSSAPRHVPAAGSASAAPLLRVRGLTGPGLDGAVDLDLAVGEVLGITGLIGSGAADVARLLGGSPKVRGGSATLDGRPLPLGRPRAMRLAGCNYVPGDRTRDGAMATLTVRENFFPVRLGDGADDRRWRAPRRERAAAGRLAERYGVRPAGAAEQPLETLSGGNQQKVVFGRALRTAPRLLVLAEPTAGVDVGAREELYALVRRAAADGAAVVLASSDFEEVVQEAGRALVMVRGRVAAELAGPQLTRDALAAASYAGTQGEAA
jgi:ribose transport system ATP-binding protein